MNDWYEWNCKRSGDMYAWKRCYLEVDKMFRAGAYLDADAAAGQKQIQLQSVAGLAANDKIYVFESDTWNEGQWTEGDHEFAEIESINAETKTITVKANLTNAYAKGASGKEAAVGKLIYSNGQLDYAATFFLVDLSLLKSCFDPGFVEFEELSDGAGPVPYQHVIGTVVQEYTDFSQRWFKNKIHRQEDRPVDRPQRAGLDTGKMNYFHIIAAFEAGEPLANGSTAYWANYTYLWVGKIEATFGVNAAEAKRDVLCHEVGHQFDIIYDDSINHCHLDAYAPPRDNEKCVMNIERDRTNGVARFCFDHILLGFVGAGGGGPPVLEPSLRDEAEGR